MFAPPLLKNPNPPVSSISLWKIIQSQWLKCGSVDNSSTSQLSTPNEGKENLNQCFLIRCCFPQTSFLFNLEKNKTIGVLHLFMIQFTCYFYNPSSTLIH